MTQGAAIQPSAATARRQPSALAGALRVVAWSLLRPIRAAAWTEGRPIYQPMLLHALALAMILLGYVGLSVFVVEPHSYFRFSLLELIIIGSVLLLPVAAGYPAAALLLIAPASRGLGLRNAYRRALVRLWAISPQQAALGLGLFLVERWGEELGMLAATFTFVFWQWLVILAALRAGPTFERCRWPAACESCGYTILGLPPDADCPECGQTARFSLSDETRPGFAWRLRDPRGILRAAAQAVFRPRAFASRIQVYQPASWHAPLLLFAAIHAPIVGLGVGVVAYLAEISEPPKDLALGTLWITLCQVGLALAITLLATAAVGMVYCVGARRDLLPVAVQAGALLNGLGALAAGASWLVGIALLVASFYDIELGALGPMGLLILTLAPMAAWLLLQVLLLWRILAAARFANR